MAEQAYSNVIPPSNENIYDKVMTQAPKFLKLRAEEISDKLGTKFASDSFALQTRKSWGYDRLRKELVDFIADSRSGQSWRNVALNEVGDRFLSVLSYIKMYETNEKFGADPNKIERLRKEVMTAFFEKLGYMALFFVPKENKVDFQRIVRDYEIENYKRQQKSS